MALNVELRRKISNSFEHDDSLIYVKTRWDNIDGKPVDYTPAPHTHAIVEESFNTNTILIHDLTYVSAGNFKTNIKIIDEDKLIFVQFPTTSSTSTLRVSVNNGTTYYNVVKNGNTMRANVVSGQLVRLQFDGTKFVADIQGDVEIVEEYSDAIESTFGQFNPHDGGVPIVREVQGRTIPALENLVENGDFVSDSNADGLANNWSTYAVEPTYTLNDGQRIQYTNSSGSNQYVGIQNTVYKSANNGDVIFNIIRAKNGTTNTTSNTIVIGLRFYNGSTALGNIFNTFALTSNYQIFKGAIILNNVNITQVKPLILREVNNTQIVDFHFDDFQQFNLTASHGVTETSGTAYDNAVAHIETMLALNGGHISTTPTTHLENSEFKSVGKNLVDFNGKWTNATATVTKIPNGVRLSGTYYARYAFTSFIVGQSYIMHWTATTISGTPNTRWRLLYNDGTLSATTINGTSIVIEKPVVEIYLYVEFAGVTTVVDFTNLQLEQGTVATTYAPYNTETQKFNHGRLSKLPNGVSDKISYRNGAYVLDRYVAEYTLQASDITLNTSLINVDFIVISGILGIIKSTYPAVADHMTEGFTTYIGSITDINTSDLIGYSIHSLWFGDDIFLILAKGTYANVAEAQADLAGTKIWYQLATPLLANEVIDVDGTLIQESVTTVEQLQNIPTTYKLEYSMNTEQTTKTLVHRDKLQQLEIDSLETALSTHDTHNDARYLGKTAKAVDSEKTNGYIIEKVTQAQYNALTKQSDTIYFIVG